jgi:uncharacterized damage-inducible protein DinB
MRNNTTIDITHADILLFVDRAIDGMLKIIEELGDDLANEKPDLPNANSPYAILNHCVGVVNHWVGNAIADRGIPRDRDSEFTATGTYEELKAEAKACRDRLAADLQLLDGLAPLSAPPPASYEPKGGPAKWTQGASLIHTYEELAQHYGQMELTRDVLLAQRR